MDTTKSHWFAETEAVYQEVMGQLSINLNLIHSVNRSNRFWEILIGAWLRQFVDMVMLRLYQIENQKDFPASTTHFAPANSLQEFQQFSKNSAFVEHLHQRVIAQFGNHIVITPEVKFAEPKSCSSKNKAKLGRAFISSSYLPRNMEVSLQIRLGRLPRRLQSKNGFQFEINHAQRKLIGQVNRQYRKESVLIMELAAHFIPRTYVEGFASLSQLPKPWKGSRIPRTIFTANRHLYDDSFNYWTATAVENGTYLVLAQHGGQFGISQYPSFSERHEISVSDRYLTWGWSSGTKCIPAFVFTKHNKKITNNRDGHLLIVTDQLWKYPRSIFTDLSDSSNYLSHLAKTINILPTTIKSNSLIRIHHGDKDAGASQEVFWHEHCQDIKHDSQGTDFDTRLSESRLALVAHNGTTIPECFALNFPIIITWNDSYMIVRESAKEAFEALEKVGVFHQSPESAAAFIEKIWHDVDGWWNSEDVISARSLFTNQFARTTNRPVKFMVKALRF